ncbi:thioredoxin family protein, partial [Chloroflexota bacterium]
MLFAAVQLLLRRDEPWFPVPRFPSSRAFVTALTILLVLGSFLPTAVSAAAIAGGSESPAAVSQPARSNTGVCGGVVQDDVDNVIQDESGALYGLDSIDLRISNALETIDAVFLFFYADWCGFCKKEKPTIDALEQQYSGQISFLRLNNEKEADAFKQFGVTGFPTMYLISDIGVNGDYISQKFVGYSEEAKLKASFDQVISGGGPAQGSVSATIALPANDPVPVLNNDYDGTCFGLSSYDPAVCNGGTCVGLDTCVCPEGWTGANCQIEEKWYCAGVAHDDPAVCSEHGECVVGGGCVCDYGYEGEACENVVSDSWNCFEMAKGDPSACNGGECVAPDTCECPEGFTGDECLELADCSVSGCYYGTCVGENICECDPGWTGPSCLEYFICYGTPSIFACSGDGECLATDTCVCDEFHYGNECQYEKVCYGTYAGDPGVCSGTGECQADGTCVCDYGWGGDRCNVPLDVCDGYISTDYMACNQRGSCEDDGTEN